MFEINLKLKSKIVNCEVKSIKTAWIVEEPEIESIIFSKKQKKELKKLLIEELKRRTIFGNFTNG